MNGGGTPKNMAVEKKDVFEFLFKNDVSVELLRKAWELSRKCTCVNNSCIRGGSNCKCTPKRQNWIYLEPTTTINAWIHTSEQTESNKKCNHTHTAISYM
jgi:hypothetical protein